MIYYKNTCDLCGKELNCIPNTIVWSITISQISPAVTYPNTYKICDECYKKMFDIFNEKTYK